MQVYSRTFCIFSYFGECKNVLFLQMPVSNKNPRIAEESVILITRSIRRQWAIHIHKVARSSILIRRIAIIASSKNKYIFNIENS